jgi:uncharacterized protein YndB with AHSA1/START domain
MLESFSESILIAAPLATVWNHLTNTESMRQWMGDAAMSVEVETTWITGTPIVIRGTHHGRFESTGTVLHIAPMKELRYTHLSSLSGLPATPENHTVLTFTLKPVGDGTALTLVATHFPTMEIYKHLQFYWSVTLASFQQAIESGRLGVVES